MHSAPERKETGIGKILVVASALLAVLFAGFGQGRAPATSAYGAPLPVLVALESRGPITPSFERKGDGSPAHADRSRGRGRAVAVDPSDSLPRGPSEHAVQRFATLPESISLAVAESFELGHLLQGSTSTNEAPRVLARQFREAVPSPRDPPTSRAS